MINSKTVDVLMSFEKDEVKSFRKFITSPYFNTRPKAVILYDKLMKFYPSFESEVLTVQYLYFCLYPEGKFAESTVYDLFTELQNLAERFLAQRGFEKDKMRRYDYLLGELTEKNLPGVFEKVVNEMEMEFFKEPRIDVWSFYDRYRTEADKYNFVAANDKILKSKDLNSETGHLVKAFVNEVNFFVTDLTAAYVNLVTYAADYEIAELMETAKRFMECLNIKELGNRLGNHNPAGYIFDIYAALYAAFEDFNNDEKYFEYKDTLVRYEDRLSPDEMSFHYSTMTAYCTMKIYGGKANEDTVQKFSLEISALYNTMLEKKYYANRKIKFLHHELFRVILLHGLRMKTIDWTRAFIDKYSDEVQPRMRAEMRNFGYAFLELTSGNHDGALEYAAKIPQDSFIFKYDVKNLILRIYAERGEIAAALDLIDTYKRTLSSETLISAERRKRFWNFLKFTEKLLRKMDGKRLDIEYFFDKLKKEGNVSYKEWLVERYEVYLESVKKTG